MKHLTILAGALALAVFMVILSPPALSQDTELDGALSGDDALVEDARIYAAEQSVSVEEASRRLKLQDDVGKLGAELEENERSTYAGLFIQHEPNYRVIVRFTQGGEQRIRPYVEGSPLESLIELESASATLAELRAIQQAATRTVRDLGIETDSFTHVQDNQVELRVLNIERLGSTLRQANIGLSNEIVTTEVEQLAKHEASIYAGFPLFWSGLAGSHYCTSGFSVRNVYNGIEGASTAYHCSDGTQRVLQYRRGNDLPYVTGAYGSHYDVEWREI